MAAASSPNNSSNPPTFHSFTNGHDPDTTFVLADPDTFRDVVQRLTGASSGENAPCRRPAARKLKLNLHHDNGGGGGALHSLSSPARNHRSSQALVASPVSPLEYPAAPTPTEEEEMAIAAKRFYLHRSPFRTPAGSDPPELLPLFPLRSSPTQSYETSSF